VEVAVNFAHGIPHCSVTNNLLKMGFKVLSMTLRSLPTACTEHCQQEFFVVSFVSLRHVNFASCEVGDEVRMVLFLLSMLW